MRRDLSRARRNDGSFSRSACWRSHIRCALLLAVGRSHGRRLRQLLATGIYVWDGGNLAAGRVRCLEGQRVVVVCRPPASNEFRYAGASRGVAKRVSEKLVENVKGIDVVNPREVDNWVDESDWGDFRELAKAVNADKVVYIELDDFELYKGTTLYQGNADVTVSVHDMKNHNKQEWEPHLGEILYPVNSGIPAQDKPPQQFEREFVERVAEQHRREFLPARSERRVRARRDGESIAIANIGWLGSKAEPSSSCSRWGRRPRRPQAIRSLQSAGGSRRGLGGGTGLSGRGRLLLISAGPAGRPRR